MKTMRKQIAGYLYKRRGEERLRVSFAGAVLEGSGFVGILAVLVIVIFLVLGGFFSS